MGVTGIKLHLLRMNFLMIISLLGICSSVNIQQMQKVTRAFGNLVADCRVLNCFRLLQREIL